MSGDPGEEPLDAWSIVHTASGIALGLVIHNPLLALALLLLYEAFEAVLRRVPRRGRRAGVFEPESWRNIRFDILFGMIGWLLAQGLPAPDVPFLPSGLLGP